MRIRKSIWIGGGIAAVAVVFVTAAVAGWKLCDNPFGSYQRKCRQIAAKISLDPEVRRDRERLGWISGYLGVVAEFFSASPDGETRGFQQKALINAKALGISDVDLARSIEAGAIQAKADISGENLEPLFEKLIPMQMEVLDIDIRQNLSVVVRY